VRLARYRWRIAAVLSSLVLASSMLVISGAATVAVGPGSMIAVSGGWRDGNCGTDQAIFDVRLFRDTNYNGTMWRFCSNYNDFCWVPYGNDSSDAASCALGWDAGTANDYASSAKFVSILGGASCYVELREHRNYQGGSYKQWDPVWVSSFVPWPNDVMSSIRRVC
jgi:hypothetical protein